MNDFVRLPFYAKLASVLLSLTLMLLLLYVGKSVFVPILIALLFAILIRPINMFFRRKLRFPSIIASIISVTFFVIIILGIITFISWQVSSFSKDWTTIERNMTIHVSKIQAFLRETFNVTETEQIEYLNQTAAESKSKLTTMATNFLMSFSDTLFNMTLIPIYMFLFLLYQNHFITFLSRLVGEGDQNRLKAILYQIKTAVQSYLFGVCIQVVSIAALTTIGLSIVGVPYALLLGVITGILGLIPYLGIILACAITLFATLTGSPDLSLIFGVILVTVIVQIIDNNILVPLVVSSKVEINAIASIVGIFAGGMLAGIAGMFLAIPMIAILKVIFDNIPALSPWGYLIGDDLPKIPQWYKKVPYLANMKGIPKATSEIPTFTATTTHLEDENKMEENEESEDEKTS